MAEILVNDEKQNNLRVFKVIRSNSDGSKAKQKYSQDIQAKSISIVNKTQYQQKSSGIDFATSLISKIKKVDRLRKGNSEKKCSIVSQYRQPQGLNMPDKIKQSQNYYHQYLQLNENVNQIPNLLNQNAKILFKNSSLEEQFQRLKQENAELKSKIQQLILTVQLYNKKIIKIQNEQVKKELSFAKRQIYLKSKEDKFAYQFAQIHQKMAKIERQKDQLTNVLSNINMKKDQKIMNIQSVLSEIFQPTFESPLLKVQQQLKSMKVNMLSLQKKFFYDYNQLKRNKDEEIKNLQKTFFKNLNHYKTIIMKFTSKTKPSNKNFLEHDLIETAIVEISSQQSIDESDLS